MTADTVQVLHRCGLIIRSYDALWYRLGLTRPPTRTSHSHVRFVRFSTARCPSGSRIFFKTGFLGSSLHKQNVVEAQVGVPLPPTAFRCRGRGIASTHVFRRV